MMWLRWMIRQDDIDPGTWIRLHDPALPRPVASRLFVPVDTHIFTWARRNGVITQKSPNWRAVEKITAHFRAMCPDDPVKYDFEICHAEMARARGL
jgi:uncharacterized protein (TIGR02757 family)